MPKKKHVKNEKLIYLKLNKKKLGKNSNKRIELKNLNSFSLKKNKSEKEKKLFKESITGLSKELRV